MKSRKISNYLTQVFETKDKSAEWFGYYNYDPLNHDKTRMLCNRSKSEKPTIKPEDYIELGYYEIESGEWHHIDYSNAWNWQQGAMMQWLPGEGNQNKVIYNCSKNNHLISRIKDLNTDETIDVNWSIYGITPDGKKSITLDFERSYWCRAYHYQTVANPEKDGRVIEGDGIFEIDLEKNKRRLLIDIQEIINFCPDEEFKLMKHWVEHIMINPAGDRFCFLHRYSSEGNVLSYKTRLFIANIDGTGLSVIPNWNKFMWSHFGWRGGDDFAIYTYQGYRHPISGNLNNLVHTPMKLGIKLFNAFTYRYLPYSLSKALNGKRQYYQLYSLNDNNQPELIEEIESSLFCIDGHPSFTSDRRYMLTDSYTDRNNYRRFIVYDTLTRKGMIIAKMPENREIGNVDCDLHPKLSLDNNYVIFDTTSTGSHSMLMLKLEWPLIKRRISR